jgi:hypothetical protein
MNAGLIDSILYFMAFIPLVMVPIVVLQIGPYVVIKGINTLMKADAEEGSAERYFGISPEDDNDSRDKTEDLLEADTYKINRDHIEDQLHTRRYIGAKVLSVVTVAAILGNGYLEGVFDAELMVNFLMNKMTSAFLIGVLFYGASMMALFDQFKEAKHGRLIESLIFYVDGIVIATIAGIIVATVRF